MLVLNSSDILMHRFVLMCGFKGYFPQIYRLFWASVGVLEFSGCLICELAYRKMIN